MDYYFTDNRKSATIIAKPVTLGMIRLLLILLFPSIAYSQNDVRASNIQLFPKNLDTLYMFTGNILVFDLSQYPTENSYSYTCNGGMIILNTRNTVTVIPTNTSIIVTVYMKSLKQDILNESTKTIIGKRTFYTKPVPQPYFFQNADDNYSVICNTCDIEKLNESIVLLPSLGFKKNYPKDFKYTIEDITVIVKRNNKIISQKKATKPIDSIVLTSFVPPNIKDNDIIELSIQKLYRTNTIGQHVKGNVPLKLSMRYIHNKKPIDQYSENDYNIKDCQQEIEYFSEEIAQQYELASSYESRGNAYFRCADFKNALNDYTRSISIQPNAILYYNRGNTQKILGDVEQALNDFNAALDLDSTHSKTYNNRAVIKEDRKLFSEAILDYSKSIAYDSNNYVAYNNLGNLKFDLLDYDSARINYEKCIKINSSYTDCYIGLGNVNYQKKIYKESIDNYQKAILLDSSNVIAYNNLANLESEIQDYTNANKHFDKAISINPNYADAYLNRGYMKIEMKDYSGAIKEFNKAISLSTGNIAYSYNNRGFSKYHLNDFLGALDDINKSIELDPYNSYAYKNRAIVYLAIKKKKEACEDLNKSLNLGYNKKYGGEVTELIKRHCF